MRACTVARGFSQLRVLVIVLLLQALLARQAFSEEQLVEVVVAAPYLEMHTGPGRGYPVFHVVDRGETISVLKRRTDWFRVRTGKGKEGWVRRAEMEQTLTPAGDQTRFAEANIGDFSKRRWEAGVLAGDFEGADMITAYAGYAMTANFSAELSVSQVFGNYSDSIVGRASLLAQPFPEWRLSPFFSLGTGIIYTDPNVTLVDESDRTEQIGSVGVGIRCYLTRRFLLRAEYRNSVIFQDKDDNQEINEWKAGFAFFF
ncbi:MAG: SH3 domain-containing protein [Gammaproteobacteria bacterium]